MRATRLGCSLTAPFRSRERNERMAFVMSPVTSKLKELFAVDLRSLAVFRMALGVAVLADVAVRALDLVGLYTDRGVLPRELLLALDGPGVYLSAHYWAGVQPSLQAVLFLFSAAWAVALIAGWRTRLATLVCWYLVSSLQLRQPLVYLGGDSILRLMLFWGLFLPLGARFSVDSVRGRIAPRSNQHLSGATAALLLQVCFIYWATGIQKSGDLWWNGQAVAYALGADEWVTPFGIWLRDYAGVLTVLTYADVGRGNSRPVPGVRARLDGRIPHPDRPSFLGLACGTGDDDEYRLVPAIRDGCLAAFYSCYGLGTFSRSDSRKGFAGSSVPDNIDCGARTLDVRRAPPRSANGPHSADASRPSPARRQSAPPPAIVGHVRAKPIPHVSAIRAASDPGGWVPTGANRRLQASAGCTMPSGSPSLRLELWRFDPSSTSPPTTARPGTTAGSHHNSSDASSS